MQKENVVLLYARWPQIGTSKSRIADETTQEFALEFCFACLSDLVLNVGNSDYYELIIGANTELELKLFKENYGLTGVLTSGKTQSERFHNTFSLLNKNMGYKKIILIPMDLPFLSQEDIISTFARLEEFPFVHGLESNGGIYLIGTSLTYSKNIFEGVRWSTSHSFSDLQANCGNGNVYSLRVRDDLNSFKAILNAKQEIATRCPHLYNLLLREGYYLSESRYVDFDTLPISIPVVTAIVQRKSSNGIEVLLQKRWKPSTDPIYSGTLELPSGLINQYEPAYKAVIREVKEETGLDVKIIYTNKKMEFTPYTYFGPKNDSVILFSPFYCAQQVSGGRAYLSIVFLCESIGGDLRENTHETQEPRWFNLEDIEILLNETSERIFPLDVPILRQYVDYSKKSEFPIKQQEV